MYDNMYASEASNGPGIVFWILYFAKAFGKGTGFAIGMIFLPFIFYAILAFDSSEYQETVYIESQPL